jgi:hypothetical protein
MAHHGDRHPIPIEIRPYVCATLSTGPADKPRLKIGQPDIIRPAIGVDRDRLTAPVVGAIDQDAAHAHLEHLAERNFSRGGPFRQKKYGFA